VCVCTVCYGAMCVTAQFVMLQCDCTVGYGAVCNTMPPISISTGSMIRGSNPVGGKIFSHVQTVPGSYPASCTMCTGSFAGVKRPERGADHPLIQARRLIMT
jgi:hypothetical protein